MEPESPAEEMLLAALAEGKPCEVGKERPEKATQTNTIRAAFLRHLLIDPKARGDVQLQGAWIEGEVDLSFATVRPFLLENCCIPDGIYGPGATCTTLALPGTHTGPLTLDGATIAGGVFLRNGFRAQGEVRLLGARIGGQLDCSGGAFHNQKEYALNGDGMRVEGNVFLCDTRNNKGEVLSHFTAEGEVNLAGAQIGGQLDCSGGMFCNPGKRALTLQGVRVEQSFMLRGADIQGTLNLDAAHVRDMCDAPDSWPTNISLDGFTYDRIVGGAPTDAKTRLEWLGRQPPKHHTTDLRPQPWRQLIAVLRTMGHDEAAREVGIDLRRRQWDALLTAWWNKGAYISYPLAFLARWGWWAPMCNYGMEPVRLVAIMILAWFVGGSFYADAPWLDDDACWPFVYSLELMLPVLSLGQAGRACVPEGLEWEALTWLQTIFGWAGALTLTAIATRLVRRD
ncbi:MAG: hypothetical protein JKP92_06330 [Alphaproteobacteria bacterium]|jgi:hypothetical protein|nr:hypothetical protein [Alphaproteobacteria bacterium]